MLTKKKKDEKVRNPRVDYYNAKRKHIINLAEAKRNLFGSKTKKGKKG